MQLPFLQSLVRNRRGAACTVCFVLTFTMAMILGTWSARCFLDHKLQPLPDGTIPLVTVVLGCKAFQYRDDRKAGVDSVAGA